MRRAWLAGWALCLVGVAGAQTTAPPAVRGGTESGQTLRAPADEDAFTFAIYGDRTTGKPAGLAVLRDAVTMTNHLDPSFVMTVGDLVSGYGKPAAWVRQMRDYKAIMGRLRMPWYPVAGNHDVYARPRLPRGHIPLYTQHFGPLYYSFDYRWAHFVVLFSDEGLAFHDPARTQNMSAEQLEWLRKDLAATKATQVFVFLHHPRWTPYYKGTNWDDVHAVLAADGRVQAAFAGHVHVYRDDGVRDGIRYITLATTGGKRDKRVRESVAFDHVNLVVVRRERVAMSVVPVGAVKGPDVVLGREVEELRALLQDPWVEVLGGPAQATERVLASSFAVEVRNPTTQPLTVRVDVADTEGWTFEKGPRELRLAPGTRDELQIQARAEPLLKVAARAPTLTASLTYRLASGLRQPVSIARSVPIRQVDLSEWSARQRGENRVLLLDGEGAVRVPIDLDGLRAFTLELWVRGAAPQGRQGLVTKTEGSSLGLFWSDRGGPLPRGMVHLKGHGYLSVGPQAPWVWGRWTHLALSYDGETLRLFVDGALAQAEARAGTITPNRLPLFVGADPDHRGEPTSRFRGAVDDVRLSRVCRYVEGFDPPQKHTPDADTLLLLPFDTSLGGWFPDHSGRGNHGRAAGASAPSLGRERTWN